MHELSIAEELVGQALSRAREGGLGRITRIRVSLGEDSHITGEGLSSWFDLLKDGTIAEEAVLEIDRGKGSSILLTSLLGEENHGHDGSRSRP